MKKIIILFISFILISGLYAQKIDTSKIKNAKVEKVLNSHGNSTSPLIKEMLPLSSWEFALSLTVLVFGLVIIGLEVFLVMKNKIDADNTVKFIVVTLIITSTLFLITAGYDNNQIAPAMGLLGTVAGYLLGRQQNGETKKGKNESEV
jgi:uncharacterized membrane protein YhaH (DUF805 family)